uniref:Uncharacterized protein n=1 Tax=Leersia perrieri TaxID=77586 RepID=A0A0D9W7V2_9ORYZ
MADVVAAPAEARVSGDVPARLQQALALLFPSNLAAKAVLFAVVVALLPLLPTSQTPRIWELPHILLLGLIISYGVFGQRNADSEVAAVAAAKAVDDEYQSVESYVSQIMQGPLVFEENDVVAGEDDDVTAVGKEGVQAWSSQYFPDDPLVVVADTNTGKGDESEKPLLLPVRKLKPAATEESATLTEEFMEGSIEEEEEDEFLVPKARHGGVREHAIPSPSSVLDAGLTLSPCSPPLLPPPPPPPPPPPFLGVTSGLRTKVKARSFNDYGRAGLQSGGGAGYNFRSRSAIQSSRNTFSAFDDPVSADDLEKKAAASDISSLSSDMVTDGEDDNGNEIDDYEEEEYEVERDDHVDDDDDGSCDEELFELATRPEPEEEEDEMVEDEVDRKADEFIAKFREQIRMQRVVEPGGRRS